MYGWQLLRQTHDLARGNTSVNWLYAHFATLIRLDILLSSRLRLAGLALPLAASVDHVFGLAGQDGLPCALWHSLSATQQSRTNLRWHAPPGVSPRLRRDHHPSWLGGCSRRSIAFLVGAATGSPELAPLFAPLAGVTTCPLCSAPDTRFPDDMWMHFCHMCPPVTTLA